MRSKKKRILVIDLDRDFRSVLKYTLRTQCGGHTITSCDKCRPSALAASKGFDLIIIGDDSAGEVLTELRSARRRLPCIFALTTSGDPLQAQNLQASGACAVISKWDLRTLVDSVEGALAKLVTRSRKGKPSAG